MPPAARVADPTSHGPPLNPGPGSMDVLIGNMKAWRALPSSVAAAMDGISNAMNSFMTKPQMTPADAASDLVQIAQKLVQGGGQAAGAGAPAAAGTAASQVATLVTTNVTLTATWTTASAVPGGQPAATTAYTLGIKTAAGAAASATVSAMASLADMHMCPLPCPPPPHGPGFVTKGSATVLINKLPACREQDKVMEACGGADPVALGCPTVVIGDSGSGGGGGGGGGSAGGGAESDADQSATTAAPRGMWGLIIAGVAGVGVIAAGLYLYLRGRCRGKTLRQQERGMSCAQATTSMIIHDLKGENVSEETLRTESTARGSPPGYDPVNGTFDSDVVAGLNAHGVANNGLTNDPTAAQIAAATAGGRPAMLGISNPGHWIIVDAVRTNADGTQALLVRDPGLPPGEGCREIQVGSAEWNSRIAPGNGAAMISFP